MNNLHDGVVIIVILFNLQIIRFDDCHGDEDDDEYDNVDDDSDDLIDDDAELSTGHFSWTRPDPAKC